MAQTLSEIREYVRNYLDIDDSDQDDEVINQWVRKGFNKIVRAKQTWADYYESGTIATVDGTSEYSYPTELLGGSIRQIYGPSSVLPRWGQSQAEGRFSAGASTDTSEPVAYSIQQAGTTVKFWPTPNGVYTYTVEGYRKPTDPIDDGDSAEPDLPSEDLHDVLLNFVLAEANIHQDDFEKATWFEQQANSTLAQIIAAEGKAQPYQPVVINGRKTMPDLPMKRGLWPWEI